MSVRVQPGGRPGPVHGRGNHTQVGGGHIGGGRPARVNQGRGRPAVGPTHIRPHTPLWRPAPAAFFGRRRPVVIDSSPHVHYVHRRPRHETVIIDHGEPSQSVRVLDARTSKKVALVSALVVGIMLAILGACLLPVNPIASFALLGVGSGMVFLSGTGLAAIR